VIGQEVVLTTDAGRVVVVSRTLAGRVALLTEQGDPRPVILTPDEARKVADRLQMQAAAAEGRG